jgi:ElaB/YqjD/DUF883 family membrane-anchored ribosome-binding protein
MDIRIDETAAEPQTVDEARDAVERSRQRISSTLDQLEDRIVEKKHELQDRADVLRPVRERIAERPFTAVAVAVGVGALLGSLGGGDDDEDSRTHRHARSGRMRGEMSDTDRRELREWRKARKERLRATLDRHSDDSSGDSESTSRFDGLKHQLMGAVTAAITTAVTKRVRSMAMDNINSLIGGDESRHDRGRHGQDRGFREDRPDYDRADVRY